ncbi:MAG: hypothetical protein JW722_07800 [Demequinaceae bacterium]|nr:hypothetical protein [Demequinaceae bacterium]
MKILRSILARIVVTIGVLVLAFWLSARFIVNTVNGGTVISGLASTALHLDSIQSMIAEQAQSGIESQLAAQGVDTGVPGIQDELSDGIADAVASDGFIDSVVDIIEEVESSLISQLTDDSLPLVPLSVTVDISEPLYTALASNPQLVSLIPDSAIEPVTFDLVEEDTVETVRDGYDWVERVNTWGIWIALGLLAIGFLLIRKKRWILPKMFLGIGILTLGLWWVARWLDVEWIIGRLPDDADENTKSAIRDIFPQETIDNAEGTLFKWALVFLVISAALYVGVWWFFHRLKARGEAEPEPEPLPEPVPVGAPGPMAVEASGDPGVAAAGETADVMVVETVGELADPTGEDLDPDLIILSEPEAEPPVPGPQQPAPDGSEPATGEPPTQ